MDLLVTILVIIVLASLLIVFLDHPTVNPRLRDLLWVMFVVLVILYVLRLVGITFVEIP
jgi:hypothetical protein